MYDVVILGLTSEYVHLDAKNNYKEYRTSYEVDRAVKDNFILCTHTSVDIPHLKSKHTMKFKLSFWQQSALKIDKDLQLATFIAINKLYQIGYTDFISCETAECLTRVGLYKSPSSIVFIGTEKITKDSYDIFKCNEYFFDKSLEIISKNFDDIQNYLNLLKV